MSLDSDTGITEPSLPRSEVIGVLKSFEDLDRGRCYLYRAVGFAVDALPKHHGGDSINPSELFDLCIGVVCKHSSDSSRLSDFAASAPDLFPGSFGEGVKSHYTKVYSSDGFHS
ncbi:hypothetical protein COU61_04150 [Candidatus Pacearchaeota archaeon CG10_big_fil_rev_8_21_14_0_10_35_13]|nr:MAG: hypothetical protein COU61_04150 [Candidatus Pacearchaeota archaeon CG10_big_fil_rev_8_21_14_0_10_35_13]